MPKITEEHLSEFAQWGTTAVWEGNEQEFAAELVRLARLGLWAEENFDVLNKALNECRDYRAVLAAISFPGVTAPAKDSARPAIGE